jgi:amidase
MPATQVRRRVPALSVPLLQTANGPAGLCLVGPRFGDLSLVDVGAELARGRV